MAKASAGCTKLHAEFVGHAVVGVLGFKQALTLQPKRAKEFCFQNSEMKPSLLANLILRELASSRPATIPKPLPFRMMHGLKHPPVTAG